MGGQYPDAKIRPPQTAAPHPGAAEPIVVTHKDLIQHPARFRPIAVAGRDVHRRERVMFRLFEVASPSFSGRPSLTCLSAAHRFVCDRGGRLANGLTDRGLRCSIFLRLSDVDIY